MRYFGHIAYIVAHPLSFAFAQQLPQRGRRGALRATERIIRKAPLSPISKRQRRIKPLRYHSCSGARPTLDGAVTGANPAHFTNPKGGCSSRCSEVIGCWPPPAALHQPAALCGGKQTPVSSSSPWDYGKLIFEWGRSSDRTEGSGWKSGWWWCRGWGAAGQPWGQYRWWCQP